MSNIDYSDELYEELGEFEVGVAAPQKIKENAARAVELTIRLTRRNHRSIVQLNAQLQKLQLPWYKLHPFRAQVLVGVAILVVGGFVLDTIMLIIDKF